MKGAKLDLWLSRGYFRMQQDMFTCQFVVFDNSFHAVQWLRLTVKEVSFGKDQLRLLRINQKFSVAVKPFVLSEEIETLYTRYRESINFDAPYSVESCLLGGAANNAFDTYMIEIRDADRLIAVGIFDNGLRSLAGIMNFYDPAYRRQSLGKYLMLLKINYGQTQNKAYYYPGYIVYKYPKFDYKLFPCQAATELFDSSTGQWLPFSWETATALSAGIMGEDPV